MLAYLGVLGLGLGLAVQGALAQQPAAPGQPPAVRGSEMAGATQFRAHCEVCHGTDPRAPSIAISF